jgi:hypothetical protein
LKPEKYPGADEGNRTPRKGSVFGPFNQRIDVMVKQVVDGHDLMSR